jgi:hypothetical protein
VHPFCRRRKSTAERLGRSPGSEVQSRLCGCFTFPGRWPSGRSKQRPHSQWRDRAGFAPDFPVMPLVGTQTRLALYHDRVASDKSAQSRAWTRRPHGQGASEIAPADGAPDCEPDTYFSAGRSFQGVHHRELRFSAPNCGRPDVAAQGCTRLSTSSRVLRPCASAASWTPRRDTLWMQRS